VDRLRPRAHCPVPWHVSDVVDGPDPPGTVRKGKRKVLDRAGGGGPRLVQERGFAFCVSFEERFWMYGQHVPQPGPIDPAGAAPVRSDLLRTIVHAGPAELASCCGCGGCCCCCCPRHSRGRARVAAGMARACRRCCRRRHRCQRQRRLRCCGRCGTFATGPRQGTHASTKGDRRSEHRALVRSSSSSVSPSSAGLWLWAAKLLLPLVMSAATDPRPPSRARACRFAAAHGGAGGDGK
jgi:hypothetical protein